MQLRGLVATLVSAATLGLSSPTFADFYDWTQNVGHGGLDFIQAVTQQSNDPVLSALPYISYLLQIADYGGETVNRAVTNDETWEQAAVEQGVIDGSGLLLSNSLNGLLADCFASGACVLSTAGGVATLGTAAAIIGIGIDAQLTSKIIEADIDISRNRQQLVATLQQIQQLQQRVDQQNALKQQLQAQRLTVQGQAQGSAQLAQSLPVAPKTEPSSIVTTIPNTEVMTVKNLAAKATSLPNVAPGSSNLTEIGVGPAKLVNTFGGPVLIGEPAIIGPIGAAPAKVGTPVDVANATTIGTPSGSPINTAASSGPSTTNSPAAAQSPSNGQQSTAAKYVYAQTAQSIASAQTTAAAKAQSGALTATQLQGLKSQADALKPPPLPSPPVYVAPPPPTSIVQTIRPGGISLSLAAAMRMRLSLDLDGMYFEDGNIVLTGKRQDNQIDAALFLTALRASCEPGDPYFSLDPDDGAAWLAEGQDFSAKFLDRIRGSLRLDRFDRNLPSGLVLQTVSARRDYPLIWTELAPRYPDFRSRLVFRPDWLRETRFGDILYQADVLLKELASGAPVLDSSHGMRASAIEQYASADTRSAGKGLFSIVNGMPSPQAHWSSARLWFDFVPQPPPWNARNNAFEASLLSPTNKAAADLYRTLLQRGVLTTTSAADLPLKLTSDGKAIDLSAIYPKMFVRLTDLASRRDIEGSDPNLDQLSQDVNQRINLYVGAYPELRALVWAFRAYVVAVKVLERDSGACGQIRSVPLLSAEKTAETLPTSRQSEIFLTVGRYTYAAGGSSIQQPNVTATSNQGGISLSGKNFNAFAMRAGVPTPVTQELLRRASEGVALPVWDGSTGRQYITLSVDSGDLLAAASRMSVAQTSSPQEVSRMQSDLLRTIDDQRRRQAEQIAKEEYQSRLQQWQQLKATIEKKEAAWHEAQDRWEQETRQAKERNLLSLFGPPINPSEAAKALPYALMLSPRAPSQQDLVGSTGWVQLAEWQDVFHRFGYSDHQIELIEHTGFRATVYGNERTGGITVAYSLNDPPAGSGLGGIGNLAVRDIQLKAAADLAWLVREAAGSASAVSLAAEGLADNLARYAAEQTGISKVVTFGESNSALMQVGSGDWMHVGWIDR